MEGRLQGGDQSNVNFRGEANELLGVLHPYDILPIAIKLDSRRNFMDSSEEVG